MKARFKINTKINVEHLFLMHKVNLVRIPFYAGICIALLGAMMPWFMWPFASFYPLMAAMCVFLAFLVDNGLHSHLFSREGFMIPFVLFLLTTIFMRLVNKNNIIGFISITFDAIVYLSLMKLNREEMQRMMDLFIKVFAGFLAISILFFLLYLVGLPLPSVDADNEDLGYSYTNYFLFMVDTRWETVLFPRFNSIFLEPGHLGTLTSLLLLNQLGKWKKWYNVILIITTLLTFSLAAYVLLPIIALMGAWARGKHIIIAVISIVVVLIGIAIGATFYNDGDNLVNNLILARLEINNDGEMEGDNRVTDTFDAEYEEFLTSSDLLVGREYSMEKFGFGNSGYKVFLYDNGLISLLLVFVFYLALSFSAKQSNRRVILAMLSIMTLTFIVRSAPLSYNYFIPLYAFVVDGISKASKANEELK